MKILLEFKYSDSFVYEIIRLLATYCIYQQLRMLVFHQTFFFQSKLRPIQTFYCLTYPTAILPLNVYVSNQSRTRLKFNEICYLSISSTFVYWQQRHKLEKYFIFELSQKKSQSSTTPSLTRFYCKLFSECTFYV